MENQNLEHERRQPRTNKQIIFVVCIYMLLTISNKFTANSEQSNDALIQKIDNGTSISVSSFLSQIDSGRLNGYWRHLSASEPQQNRIIQTSKGRFTFHLDRYSDSQGQIFSIKLIIKNGKYIDDGTVSLYLKEIQEKDCQVVVDSGKMILQFTNSTKPSETKYSTDLIFKNIKEGTTNLTNLQIQYSAVQKKIIKTIQLTIEQSEYILNLQGQESNIIGTVSLALILFGISFSQFSATLEILKKFMDGEENPAHYSLLTMVMALMWDASLCLVSFIESFQAQENIVLFIIPAFIFALLFTNLQLRAMFMISQANADQNNLSSAHCRFNILCYSCIIMVYPILIFTNLDSILFIAFALIYLPQIYTNAVVGKRPDPNSIYYNQFLTYRFLTVIYLRCFPLNIFELKPNYLLGVGIGILIGLQYALLWLQKIYGPKRIFPKFLLPEIYDYTPHIIDDLEMLECSICLGPLHKDPESMYEQYIGLKVMQTPCRHLYHGICLSEWMKFKMQCPQCRSKLPSFQ